MTVTEYFTRLQGKRVLVLGLGVSNRPLVRLLLRFGIDVTGCDRTPREKLDPEVLELERLGAKLHLGDDYLTGITGDVAFRTPGLHPEKPELQALRAAGTQFTSEMEAFFEVCPCRIIGVTGSDGKTTTSTLISEILKHAGHRVWTGGNIGTPLLDQAEHMTPDDLVVLELSSFQLMDLRHSCHIAVVTNLAPNHLDVHRDMAEYIDAKKHIFTRQTAQDVLILNADNAITAGFAPEAAGEVRMFSRQTVPAHGASFRDGVIRRDGVPVVRQEEIKIPGLHNVENYMAAILAVEGLASDEDIRYVARNFGGVEHRIEFVREKDGVKFYNDSIASSPSRTIAGLRSFSEKVILIAGMTSTFHMTCSARRSQRTSGSSSAPARPARRSQPRPAPFRMRRRFSKFRISMMPFTPLRSRQSPVISCCCPRRAPPLTASRTLWSEARNSRKR